MATHRNGSTRGSRSSPIIVDNAEGVIHTVDSDTESSLASLTSFKSDSDSDSDSDSGSGSTERDFSGKTLRWTVVRAYPQRKVDVYNAAHRLCPVCREFMGNISLDIASRVPGTCSETECILSEDDPITAEHWTRMANDPDYASIESRRYRFRLALRAYWHQVNAWKIMRASSWGSRQPDRLLPNVVQSERLYSRHSNVIWVSPNTELTGQNFINAVRDRQYRDRKDRMQKAIQWAATAGKTRRQRPKKGTLEWSPSAGQL